jgi:hypothetical protein
VLPGKRRFDGVHYELRAIQGTVVARVLSTKMTGSAGNDR